MADLFIAHDGLDVPERSGESWEEAYATIQYAMSSGKVSNNFVCLEAGYTFTISTDGWSGANVHKWELRSVDRGAPASQSSETPATVKAGVTSSILCRGGGYKNIYRNIIINGDDKTSQLIDLRSDAGEPLYGDPEYRVHEFYDCEFRNASRVLYFHNNPPNYIARFYRCTFDSCQVDYFKLNQCSIYIEECILKEFPNVMIHTQNGAPAGMLMKRCLFYGLYKNKGAIFSDGRYITDSYYFERCTFWGLNIIYSGSETDESRPVFNSCIFANCTYDFQSNWFAYPHYTYNLRTIVSLSYSIIFNCGSVGTKPADPGGQAGPSRDVVEGSGMIYSDPLLVAPDREIFAPGLKSPAINGADPLIGLDIDGSRQEIGAYSVLSAEEMMSASLPVIKAIQIPRNSLKPHHFNSAVKGLKYDGSWDARFLTGVLSGQVNLFDHQNNVPVEVIDDLKETYRRFNPLLPLANPSDINCTIKKVNGDGSIIIQVLWTYPDSEVNKTTLIDGFELQYDQSWGTLAPMPQKNDPIITASPSTRTVYFRVTEGIRFRIKVRAFSILARTSLTRATEVAALYNTAWANGFKDPDERGTDEGIERLFSEWDLADEFDRRTLYANWRYDEDRMPANVLVVDSSTGIIKRADSGTFRALFPDSGFKTQNSSDATVSIDGDISILECSRAGNQDVVLDEVSDGERFLVIKKSGASGTLRLYAATDESLDDQTNDVNDGRFETTEQWSSMGVHCNGSIWHVLWTYGTWTKESGTPST